MDDMDSMLSIIDGIDRAARKAGKPSKHKSARKKATDIHAGVLKSAAPDFPVEYMAQIFGDYFYPKVRDNRRVMQMLDQLTRGYKWSFIVKCAGVTTRTLDRDFLKARNYLRSVLEANGIEGIDNLDLGTLLVVLWTLYKTRNL